MSRPIYFITRYLGTWHLFLIAATRQFLRKGHRLDLYTYWLLQLQPPALRSNLCNLIRFETFQYSDCRFIFDDFLFHSQEKLSLSWKHTFTIRTLPWAYLTLRLCWSSLLRAPWHATSIARSVIQAASFSYSVESRPLYVKTNKND